ncbi:copper resistance protein NlpE N-terminal domain-containing protein [Galbibacter mesophilus]|uniref:copper resistance protein NlpE N-terminal domain-containing protein n=1 Tax=Galbibacter mesophilus TaxID=379069 RepID=UPI00191CC20A|nr:copper resistance protein NlpE N-terminal domain-containing protein [Galbibacter mesophilus]MCM5663730.1 copper resistance protein NlpE N-terminal domain-containing protein [Galbibacter mesophilus]
MKKLSINILVALATVASFVSCNEKAKKQEDEATTLTEEKVTGNDEHTSENSLDWNGKYKGTLPCADCAGIETSLELKKDETYVLTSKYIGKEDDPIEKTGTFEWNQEGNQVTLEGDAQQQYFVGENTLTKLDNEGKKVEGDLAEKYVLKKESMVTDTTLTDKKWKLVTLMGKPISEIEETATEPFIEFSSEENRVGGNAGCNNFSGSYTLKEGNRFETSPLATTMKACMKMQVEGQLMKVLEKVDTYTIKDGKLSLTKGKMAPLAVFEEAK